jgi:hypothetical protein
MQEYESSASTFASTVPALPLTDLHADHILLSVADGVADLHTVLARTEPYMTDELMRRRQPHAKHVGRVARVC